MKLTAEAPATSARSSGVGVFAETGRLLASLICYHYQPIENLPQSALVNVKLCTFHESGRQRTPRACTCAEWLDSGRLPALATHLDTIRNQLSKQTWNVDPFASQRSGQRIPNRTKMSALCWVRPATPLGAIYSATLTDADLIWSLRFRWSTWSRLRKLCGLIYWIE